MKEYIDDFLLKYVHAKPMHPQLNPHKHLQIKYGAKQQLRPEDDTSLSIDTTGVKNIQAIIGALLYYAHAVDNKLIVSLSAIGAQQASATESTVDAINQLIDYIATYPNDSNVYCESDMVLAGHLMLAFTNESKFRSRAGAHIFLSENGPEPRWKGTILTIYQIIKFVMTSAAEAEL